MKWTVVVAVLLAIVLAANGGYMLANPGDWYLAVPGVADTGPFNPHFVRDIGFIYLLTGAALLLGVYVPDQRPGLWGLSAAWHLSHAAFHVWEVVVGICGPEALLRDFAGVTLPGILMLVIAIAAWRAGSSAIVAS